MEKYGFIYIWRDRKHKRYYIGAHWGTEDDGYICSSSWMKLGYKKRPNDFKRRIIERIYTTKKDMFEAEYKWLQMIKPEEIKHRYYNLRINWKHPAWEYDQHKIKTIGEKISTSHRTYEERTGKPWGWWMNERFISTDTKQKIRQANLGKTYSKEVNAKKGRPLSDERKQQNSEFMKEHYQNNPRSIETRQKIRKNSKRLQAEGKIGTKGKKYSAESKTKMSEAQKKCKAGVKWWTNGYVNKQCKEPPGPDFIRGRSKFEKSIGKF